MKKKTYILTWTADKKKIIKISFGTGSTRILSTGIIGTKHYIETDEHLSPASTDTDTTNAASTENMSDTYMEIKAENS